MTNSNKPRILLYAGFKDKTVFYFSISPPLGLFRLKHYLEKRGMECDVHDLTLHDGDFGDTKEKIAKDELLLDRNRPFVAPRLLLENRTTWSDRRHHRPVRTGTVNLGFSPDP